MAELEWRTTGYNTQSAVLEPIGELTVSWENGSYYGTVFGTRLPDRFSNAEAAKRRVTLSARNMLARALSSVA